MATINELKEQSITETPLLLFDCQLAAGATERWSTHQVEFEGHRYEARVLRHNLFEIRAGSEEGIDSLARISISLANADSHFSQIERNTGWKGAKVTVRFVFFDLRQGTAASEAAVLFRGIADTPVEITESTFRLTISNSLNLQRVALPDVRVERRCPWAFPANAAERAEAVAGAPGKWRYSRFFRCGYSPDQEDGVGNLNGGTAYTTCRRTKAECQARGMFSKDSSDRTTARFGGIEFVPSSTTVRSYGEKGSHVSDALSNEARYNDFVPLVYGTAWYAPPIVFSKNDGNLTRMEVLLGMGELQSVVKVLVNDIEIPLGRTGADMTATGWFNVVTVGGRSGGFNLNFTDTAGNPLGDPYGSMAMMSVVVPNQVNDGRSLPQIDVLAEGLKLERFGPDGDYLGEEFTNNPVWVLLDVLQRCGWSLDDIDLATFGKAAEICEELIPARDLYGNTVEIPRFQCNLVLRKRRSTADLVRGIRNGARLFLTYGLGGQLELHVENTLALEQPVKPAGSNSVEALEGGWPSYEFGDGSNGFSGIMRKQSGEPAIRVWSKSTAETPNRVTLEFQDAFNGYQQDSLSLTDADDVSAAGQEISLALPALGIPNFDQAARIAKFHLDKAIVANTYIELETSVRGLGLKPGDLITVTYLKEGFERQPFRVVKIAPGVNYGTAFVTAQIHGDGWYTDDNLLENSGSGRQPGRGAGMPRPLVGKVLDEDGVAQFEIVEKASEGADGSTRLTLAAGFIAPPRPAMSGLGIPIVSLAAQAEPEGGTLAGDQTLYYAVTAGNADGAESGLSFTVRATIPPPTNTNRVTLGGLSFSADATGFSVYRGKTPVQLYRIASGQTIAATFTDAGLASELAPPPDANYDHANIYWRLELLPECAATTYSNSTIGNSTLGMAVDGYQGAVVRVTKGKGAGQERVIRSNTATTLTVGVKWDVVPDGTSQFAIAESGWHLGASGSSSPVEFEVPTRVGATVHVSGRAANAHDRECAFELSPLTRWRISGAGAALDADVPGKPDFGLAPRGRGAVELMTIAFEDLTNTRTILSATLTLNYWNELSSPSQILLSSAIGDSDTQIDLTQAGGGTAGDLVQMEAEVVRIEEVLNGGLQYRVTRGAEESTAAAHAAQTPLYHLNTKVFVVPLARDFFGSPASGSFSYPILIPDARIASARLFVTNAKGNSEAGLACYAGTASHGLRTLSGGQFTIQVEGYLAIQTNAAPPLIAQESHSVREIFAVVNQAPTLAPVELEVRRDEALYCSLTIPAGSKYSNVVNGFGLAPLAGGTQINLDIISVGEDADALPGRDLTVTIRM